LESRLRACVEVNPQDPMAAIDAGIEVIDQAYAECREVGRAFKP
jgi:hypothetical protein